MLVLSRKMGERIVIGDDVTITVSRISGNRVSIGVEAPSDIKVIRGELKRFRDEFAGDKATAAPSPSLNSEAGSLACLARSAR